MSDNEPNLWIIGTGGHARVVLDLARASGHAVAGFIEPNERAESPGFLWGLPVLVGVRSLRDLDAPPVAVAIGDNSRRRETTAEATALGARVETLIHPAALLEDSVTIDSGAQVCIGSILCAGCHIGSGALINSGAIIEHESRVGAFVHVCPGAKLAGRVTVGAGAMVGLGASVIQGITIGENAVVGAGAVVIEDVPAGATVVGIPAKPS